MSGGVEHVQSARKTWQRHLCGAPIAVGQPYTRYRRWGRPVVVVHRVGQCQESTEGHENR